METLSVFVVFSQFMRDPPRLEDIFKHREDAEAMVKKWYDHDLEHEIPYNEYWIEEKILK